MDRAKQIRSDILQKFFKDNGRMPTEKELGRLILLQGEYQPISKPMVPLTNAKSIADYTREDLLGLIKDRNLIDDLLADVSSQISRVEYAANAEAVYLLNQAELMLTDHQSNTFNNVYDRPAQIPGEADVANWYIVAEGTDSLYIQDDGTSSVPSYVSQWITLDSFNVDSGKEGISISPSNSTKLVVNLNIGPYAEEDYAILQTLNEADPISIVASGLEGINKGIEIEIPMVEKRISTIKLDTNSIMCSVLVDDSQLFTKSLDGPSTLSIGAVVQDSIKIRLYGTTSQVNILIRDLAVYSSTESAEGSYDYGQYVSLQIPVDKKHGNLLFNPDEYIPPGTLINWEWSNSRITWYPALQNTDGKYELKRPDETIWNTKESSIAQDAQVFNEYLGPNDGHSFRKIVEFGADGEVIDHNVKLGKGCILFLTNKNPNSVNPYNFQFTGFLFYIEVEDDTGYTLELSNPLTNSGQKIFSSISIESEKETKTESAGDSIYYDLDKGIHKIQLELSDSIEFNYEEQEDGFGTGFEGDEGSFKYGVTKRLEREYGALLNWTLGADRLGRSCNIWIEPYGVDTFDTHEAFMNRNFIFTGSAKVGPVVKKAAIVNEMDNIRPNNNHIFTKYITAGLDYEVLPVHPTMYTSTSEAHTGYEVHYYSGDGSADWEVDMYHTPNGNVTLNENGVAYTPVGSTVTVPNAAISSTLDTKKEFLQYSGDAANISFDLQHTPISGTFSLDRHNIVDNVDLDPVEGIDENFISFFPAGRALETFTSASTDVQTPAALTYRPTLGYCLVNEVYDQSIIEEASCTDTWVSGYCSDGSSLTEGDCLAAGSCSGYETTAGTPDEIQPTDKTTCETQPGGGTAGTWTSTSSWTKYIVVTSSDGIYEYEVDSFDFSTNEVTISGLTGTSGNTINIYYEYGEFQSTQTQYQHIQHHEVLATNESVILDRTPYDPANNPALVIAPLDITGVNLTPVLDSGLNKYKIDLSGYTSSSDPLAIGDIITIKYLIEPIVTVDQSKLNIENIPNTLTVRKVNKEYGTTINPTAATTLTMEHPVAFREQPGGDSGPNSNVYIEINGSQVAGYCIDFKTDGVTADDPQPTDKTTCETDPDAGGPGLAGTWHDIVEGIEGNILTLDLTPYKVADDQVQDVVSIIVIYESYEHTYPWKLNISYDYYQQEAYSFNYSYLDSRRATYNEIYNSMVMRDYFFDISYRETTGDDLYLKATLTSETGQESPIIRRIRLEQQ